MVMTHEAVLDACTTVPHSECSRAAQQRVRCDAGVAQRMWFAQAWPPGRRFRGDLKPARVPHDLAERWQRAARTQTAQTSTAVSPMLVRALALTPVAGKRQAGADQMCLRTRKNSFPTAPEIPTIAR